MDYSQIPIPRGSTLIVKYSVDYIDPENGDPGESINTTTQNVQGNMGIFEKEIEEVYKTHGFHNITHIDVLTQIVKRRMEDEMGINTVKAVKITRVHHSPGI